MFTRLNQGEKQLAFPGLRIEGSRKAPRIVDRLPAMQRIWLALSRALVLLVCAIGLQAASISIDRQGILLIDGDRVFRDVLQLRFLS
jgi:hypothetical protein